MSWLISCILSVCDGHQAHGYNRWPAPQIKPDMDGYNGREPWKHSYLLSNKKYLGNSQNMVTNLSTELEKNNSEIP